MGREKQEEPQNCLILEGNEGPKPQIYAMAPTSYIKNS